MTEKRYYQRDFEELYYVIDSNVISEKEFDERVEYDGYSAFEDSLTGEEIVELLNENEELKYSLAAHMVDLNNCKGECSVLELENKQLKSDLKLALPVLLAIDFKISINECEAINRLCNAINDDFITGKDCDVE